MPERILFPEFRDELEPTKYPFGDTATLQDPGGGISIDRDTFLDATLYPIGAQGRLFIGEITVTAYAVTVAIHDEGKVARCTARFDPANPPDLLYFTDDWGRPAGILVSESLRLARFGAWAEGTYQFNIEGTELASSCCIPTPERGVRGALSELDELFTGDMWLVGDNGVCVRQEDPQTIRVDIVGDPLFIRKQCSKVELFTPPRFIKTINHCPPDAYGNFHLVVGDDKAPDTIVRIYPTDTNTLRIEAVGQLVKEGQ